MNFETNKDVLDWYERQERVLTLGFISAIPWEKVKDHPVDENLIPVLLYMRDVETLTDMYHRELLRTPTGKDRDISKFMERWGIEEITHGEVLNRFLNEIGVETDDNWQTQVRKDVTTSYHSISYLMMILTNLIGKKFTATHMTFGAIHEMEAAQGLSAPSASRRVCPGLRRSGSIEWFMSGSLSGLIWSALKIGIDCAPAYRAPPQY